MPSFSSYATGTIFYQQGQSTAWDMLQYVSFLQHFLWSCISKFSGCTLAGNYLTFKQLSDIEWVANTTAVPTTTTNEFFDAELEYVCITNAGQGRQGWIKHISLAWLYVVHVKTMCCFLSHVTLMSGHCMPRSSTQRQRQEQRLPLASRTPMLLTFLLPLHLNAMTVEPCIAILNLLLLLPLNRCFT